MQTQPNSMRVLVVDDEAPARKRLVSLLSRDCEIGEVLEAEGGIEAVEAIQSRCPDVVFLDVQMPGVDGFAVIDAIGTRAMPLTVFVTGYDRFALQAFEADAIDYLLKPFANARFHETIERIKRRLEQIQPGESGGPNSFGPEVLEFAAKRFKPGEIWRWIGVKNQRGVRLVLTEDIDCIKADGVYVILHIGEAEYIYRAGLADVAARLDPLQFVRVHRSSIVNMNSIAFLERRSHSEFEIVLKSQKRLTLSRNYRASFEAALGQQL